MLLSECLNKPGFYTVSGIASGEEDFVIVTKEHTAYFLGKGCEGQKVMAPSHWYAEKSTGYCEFINGEEIPSGKLNEQS